MPVKVKTRKTITKEIVMDEARLIHALRAYLTREVGLEWNKSNIVLFQVEHHDPIVGGAFATEINLKATVSYDEADEDIK